MVNTTLSTNHVRALLISALLEGPPDIARGHPSLSLCSLDVLGCVKVYVHAYVIGPA